MKEGRESGHEDLFVRAVGVFCMMLSGEYMLSYICPNLQTREYQECTVAYTTLMGICAGSATVTQVPSWCWVLVVLEAACLRSQGYRKPLYLPLSFC